MFLTLLSFSGLPKGLKVVLTERGLWKDGMRLRCNDKCLGSTMCCARNTIDHEHDFMEQKCMLEELIVAAGQMIIFYPKFHCELNFIESFWGADKVYVRKNCDCSWKGLVSTVPKAPESVSLKTIRRHVQECFRKMDVYRKDLTGKAAEYSVKKYRSHRRVSNSIMMHINVIGVINE